LRSPSRSRTTSATAAQALERSRAVCLLATIAVIAAGLASRKFAWLFPAALGKYPGDALWALMVYTGWGMVLPWLPAPRLAACALATSFAVEFSQRYHAPWLDGIRATVPGHLVLGSGFSWIDLAAYTVGVAVGFVGDLLLHGAWRTGAVRKV
jgi:hypothetical protein